MDEIIGEYFKLNDYVEAFERQKTLGINEEEEKLEMVKDTMTSIEQLMVPIQAANTDIDLIEMVKTNIKE